MEHHSVFVDCHLTKDVYGACNGTSIHVMSMQAMAMRYANNSYLVCMHGMERFVLLGSGFFHFTLILYPSSDSKPLI